MNGTMKALVKYGPNAGETAIQDKPIPQIGADDVLVKVAYIGICGTDPHMHMNLTNLKVAVPMIFGHEFAGTIVEAGANVQGWNLGDRVTVETHADYCGVCVMCRTNRYHLCRDRKGYGFQIDGAFASYVKAPSRILHKVPDNVSLRDASLTEPLCVGYKSMVSNSTIHPGDTVVVIGPGPIGMVCIKMAQLCGASEIIAVGANGDEKRLEMALTYGATAAVNSQAPGAIEQIMSLTDGYGADVVADTAGVSPTLKLSLQVVRPFGQITKIGWGPKPVDFSLDQLLQKSATLQGHFSHTWDVWEKCLTLMKKGQVDLGPLITHELPLDQWEHGFEMIENREAMKVVLTPID